jgi:hypothetical protein
MTRQRRQDRSAHTASRVPSRPRGLGAGRFHTCVAARQRPPHGRRPRPGQADGHHGSADHGTLRGAPRSALAARPEAGGLVPSHRQSAAAAAVSGRVCSRGRRRLWSRGPQRPPPRRDKERARPLPGSRALLPRVCCPRQGPALAQWSAAATPPLGPTGLGAAVDDGAVSRRARLCAAGPPGANRGGAGLAEAPEGRPLLAWAGGGRCGREP